MDKRMDSRVNQQAISIENQIKQTESTNFNDIIFETFHLTVWVNSK
jgi:hypothetical protein